MKQRRKLAPGQRYGRLTLVTRTNERKGRVWLWLAKCDCGGQALARADHLLKGRRTGCGCTRYKYKSKVKPGQRYGKLMVVARHEVSARNGIIVWRCACDCGGSHTVRSDDLTRDKSRHCGCMGVRKYRVCAGCGQRLMLTRANFYRNSVAKSGFDCKCKRCRGNQSRWKQKPTPPDARRREQLAAETWAMRAATLRQLAAYDRDRARRLRNEGFAA